MKLPEQFDPDNKMAENYSLNQDFGRKGLCIDWMHLQPGEWWEYEDSINQEYKQRRACGDSTALKMSMYEFRVWKRAVLRSNMPEWYHLANMDMPPPRLQVPPFRLKAIPDDHAAKRRASRAAKQVVDNANEAAAKRVKHDKDLIEAECLRAKQTARKMTATPKQIQDLQKI